MSNRLLLFRDNGKPLVDLNFMGSLPGVCALTRASSKRAFNASGVLAEVAANNPAFEYDPVTNGIRGLLLEGQSTNALTYSQNLSAGWTRGTGATYTDSQASPDGENNAVLVTGLNGTSIGATEATVYKSSVPIAEGVIYTVSVFARLQSATSNKFKIRIRSASPTYNYYSADTTLSTTNWTRISVTFTAPAGEASAFILFGSTGSMNVYLYGAQFEAAPAASSYIPTTGAAVTRAADSLLVTSLPWFSASKGTFAATFMTDYTPPTGCYPALATFSDGTSNNRLKINIDPGSALAGAVTTGGTLQANPSSGTLALNAVQKLAMRYKTDDVALSGNGAAAGADTSASMPTGISQLELGGFGGTATQAFKGYLRRFRYWNYGLANATLQKVTQ